MRARVVALGIRILCATAVCMAAVPSQAMDAVTTVANPEDGKVDVGDPCSCLADMSRRIANIESTFQRLFGHDPAARAAIAKMRSDFDAFDAASRKSVASGGTYTLTAVEEFVSDIERALGDEPRDSDDFWSSAKGALVSMLAKGIQRAGDSPPLGVSSRP